MSDISDIEVNKVTGGVTISGIPVAGKDAVLPFTEEEVAALKALVAKS